MFACNNDSDIPLDRYRCDPYVMHLGSFRRFATTGHKLMLRRWVAYRMELALSRGSNSLGAP